MVSSLSLFTHKVIRCRSSLIKLVVSPTSSGRISPSSSSWLGAHIGDRLSWTPRRSLQSYVSQNCQQQKRNQKHQKQQQQQLSGVNRIENTYYFYCHQRQRYFSTSTSSVSSSSCTIDEESENDDNNSNDDNDINLFSKSVASSTLESDVVEDENKRRKVADIPIQEVLDNKHSFRWVNPIIREDATIRDAIPTVIEGGLSGMMVVEAIKDISENDKDKHNSSQRVVGLLTSRDLLRMMAAGLKEDGLTDEEIMNKIVGDYMTPISQVIYARPSETIGMCRSLMAKLGVKCLPVLSKEGKVEGLITARDMNDYGLSASDKGGKKSYLNDISERVGLSSDTSMAEPPPYMLSHLALEQKPLAANVGVDELPHPFKTHDGVGSNRRDHGPQDLASDLDLSEDAYFCTRVHLEDENDQVLRDVTYFGVADGVGSWKQYGVDPRLFSHKLMEECENVLLEACHRDKDPGGGKFRRVIPPADIIAQAYERVKAENIIGSSTACVALFDCIRHQLHFSNLGDSGIIVLRHIDSDIAGTLKRDRITPRAERTSDLRVAFISQQQLFSFNHPYQLGWTGETLSSDETTSFKTARDSCTTSIHLRRGDIIIMATDGLFDNVDIDDITKIALKWEQGVGLIRGGDIAARERRWALGDSLTLLSSEKVGSLATELCEIARESSLDSTKDSPFAMLAKDNDIMWSGGMPDDCTVIVAHVVGRSVDDVANVGDQ